MFRLLLLMTICVGAVSAQAVSAQDEAAYTTWMKSTPPQINAIKAAIMANDNAKVATEAGKLADIYQKVANFWMTRQKEDAIKLAQNARDAALEIASATTPDAQNAGVMKLQGTCGACHKTYREGTPGNYKIKE